jgi:hypothetical protein
MSWRAHCEGVVEVHIVGTRARLLYICYRGDAPTPGQKLTCQFSLLSSRTINGEIRKHKSIWGAWLKKN